VKPQQVLAVLDKCHDEREEEDDEGDEAREFEGDVPEHAAWEEAV
jgi:hypothetical protein